MFECEHCHTQYSTHRGHQNHLIKCKILLRKNTLKTIKGKNAFNYYKQWLQYKKCYNTAIATFISSHYYTSFINFVDYSIEKRIPDINLYIENCKNISPNLWTNDTVYASYVKFLDNLSPAKSVVISIMTLKKLSKILDCNIDEVLMQLDIESIIKLLYSRHLSPWFLLNSVNITKILTDANVSAFQHKTLELYIKPSIWSIKFQNHKSEIKKIKEYLKNLNL